MDHVDIRPEILQWARERAGLSLATLIDRFPKLGEWEHGTSKPTLKQVENYAKVTNTPFGFMFLQEPPVEAMPIPDFRTVKSVRIARLSPKLLETLYICQQRQEWYRDYARVAGEGTIAWVGSANTSMDVVEMASRIRRTLGIDLDERNRIPTWTDALRYIIAQADAAGVLVMVSGVVGSNNRRKLDPDEFRGFALADNQAPLVFINGADSKSAQMFTLAHELAHIWLGQSAVSDAQAVSAPIHEIERWCNRVAAELLVPIEVFRAEYGKHAPLKSEVARLARRFKVSTLVILRRMHDAGGLTKAQLWHSYEEEIHRLRKIPKGSGGDFYLTLAARASKRFARALVASTLEGRTSFTEAFRLLGFKKMATFSQVGHSLGISY